MREDARTNSRAVDPYGRVCLWHKEKGRTKLGMGYDGRMNQKASARHVVGLW